MPNYMSYPSILGSFYGNNLQAALKGEILGRKENHKKGVWGGKGVNKSTGKILETE